MSEDFSPNTTLSHYRIVSKLGAGGMGEVYLAQDTKLDRKVALKILPEAFASDAERMRRFVLEAKSASALNHPNIITIYEIGEASSERLHFIATEYIEGRTLNSCASLPVTTALDVATQVVSALQAAHNAGIIHRDIKPENVIVRPDGLVKILDFGIAKVSGPVALIGVNPGTDPEAATAVKSGTSAGMIIGTASYMSPEQARGKAIDARTDIFSVGVVLYEMLARRKPFTGENPLDVIGSIVADDPTPLTQIIPTLPREVERIVNKALRKNLSERYQSATDLLADLKGCQKRLEFEAELKRTGTPEAKTEIKTVRTESRNSIAVLPFANMSTDPENEYFCDGLAEELLNALAKIDDLKVAARTSSFAFKGQNANVSEIGRTLSVNTVLEGSVRKFGDRVRITVQLINTSDGYHLWSERYDREMQDIFDVQDEITLAVVDALKVQLLGEEKEALLKRYTNNAEAYQLYLRGRFFFFKRTPDGFRKAIAYFEQAIQLDPDYALAHSGLADCYTFLGFYEIVAPSEAIAKVRPAAYKAVELDNNLAETRTSIAIFKILYEWDFRGSIEEFEAAVRINPRYAFAHHLHSAGLAAMDMTAAAVAAESLAAELEPFTAIFSASLGWWHYLGHQYEQAINQSLRTIEIAPNHFFAHWVLGITYGRTSRYEEAIEELQKADQFSDGSQHVKGDMARIYAQMGRQDEARKILDELRAQSADRYISSVTIANIFVGLGDKERVLEFLEKAREERAVRLPYFLADPCLDALRSDPKFQAIRRRVGLPEQATNEVLEAHTVLLKSSEIRADSEESELRPAVTTTVKPDTTVPGGTSSSVSSTRKIVLLSALLLVLASIGIGGYRYFSNRSTKQIESIAVMPFVNEGGNSEVEYLSDGMTEALIGRLSQLPNVNVKALSTVFRYKGKEADPKSIGKELNVQAILNGRVTQRGDRLMLSLELIDAQTENVLWSDRYDRKQTDLISLQNEIARDVSSKLKIKLSGADQQRLTKTYTTDPEVYRLYLQGRFYWNKRKKSEVEKAVTFFKQAVEKDPNFALGYIGLADSFEDIDRPTKKEYIRRALDIDDNLAEAHASLGYQYMCAQDWVASERELKRAMELNPNYAPAYAWNGARLMMIGNYNESLAAIQRALEIDPTANGINFYKGVCLAISGRRDEAIQQFKKMVEMDPTFPWTHNFLSRIYRWNGDHAASVEERAISLELDGNPEGAKRIRESFAKGGWDGFQSMLREGNAGPMARGGLSDFEKDTTIDTLTRQANEGSFWLFLIKVDPMFDPLRGDPRFQELLRRFDPPR